jgi:hypothetical protein
VAGLSLIRTLGLVLSSVGPYLSDGRYSNFRRLALADGNYLISISFSSSRQKLSRPMKGSVFLVVLGDQAARHANSLRYSPSSRPGAC